MLGKLMKHEFKTTSKVILPLYLILVVLTIFARIFAQSLFTAENSNIDSIGFGLFGGLSVILYILGLFAVSIASFIYLLVRFYKNLFGDEGYLMHTLPVTSWELLSSKLLVAFIWNLVESLLIAFSIFCIFANHYVFDAISNYFASFGGFDGMVYYYTGMHTGTFWLSLIAFILVSSFYGLLLPYASICIGQLWQKHRLAGSFLTYFLINILTQIIRTIYVGLTGNDDAITHAQNYIPTATYGFIMVLNLVLSIVFFFLCGYIMKKKVNLE